MNRSQLIIFRRIELHMGKQAIDSFRSFEEALVTEDQEYRVVFYIESRRFLIRDSPRPATTYEQKTGGADGVKGA